MPGFIVKGFHFSGISAGIKDNGKKDLSLIFSLVPAVASGVFTKNRVQAAPVILDRQLIRKGIVQAVVINSGNANACTGARGLSDATKMGAETARALGIDQRQVLVSSTGKIGVSFPIQRVTTAIPRLVKALKPDGLEDAARGILTTDKRPKYLTDSVRIGGHRIHLAGFAKGAGMIHPNMATMLAYFVTDLNIGQPLLAKIFRSIVAASFNQITVDGDMSTNDTALVMANRLVGQNPVTAGSPGARRFEGMLAEMADVLAREIVMDGEGATKCVDIFVEGAGTDAHARQIAGSIGKSLLVKTALFGEDPNWGRIVAAVGYAGVRFDPAKVDVFIGKVPLVRSGTAVGGDSQTRARREMKKVRFSIRVRLHQGNGNAHLYTSDLTYEYVRINAEYTT